jgi:hypothetical protein
MTIRALQTILAVLPRVDATQLVWSEDGCSARMDDSFVKQQWQPVSKSVSLAKSKNAAPK